MARGIPNFGCSCWLATAIQCLCRSPQVVRAMLHDGIAGPHVQAHASTGHGQVAAAFVQVVRTMWRGTGVVPRMPIRGLATALAKYRSLPTDQPQDASEAVLAIMEALHTTFREDFEAFAGAPSADHVNQKAWTAWNAQNGLSAFTEVFQMQIAQKYGDGELEFEHPWTMSVSPHGTTADIQALVDEAWVSITVDNKTLDRRVLYAPPTLVILSPAGGIRPANTVKVGEFEYELMAAGYHIGNHWLSIARTPENPHADWALLDDEHVHDLADPLDFPNPANFCVFRRCK